MFQVGQTIYDRYQLQEKLGQNAARLTWKAIDLTTSESVIVKLLAFGAQVEWDDLKLFEREAQILKQLDHAKIPKCRDYFSIDDQILWFGLVQDYIPGTSLKQLIQSGKRFSETEARRIAIDVLTILSNLHELNPQVLHRDIKPSNLIAGANDEIYLVDFGAVQDRAKIEGATFTVVGSYGYTPIEQFGGRSVPASDLYALGATLIHLLTGVCPADLPQQNLRIQWRDKVTISATFADWIDQLVHPDVNQRFQRARQAIDALNLTTSIGAFPSTRLERPKDTSVKLLRSKHRLEIIIPKERQSDVSQGRVLTGLMMLGVAVPVFMFVLPMMLLFLLYGISNSATWIALFALIGFVLFVSPAFERTYIRFDRREFVVETQRFGATSNRMTGVTADIREVRRDNLCKQIAITSGPYRTGYRLHRFGQELTDFEQAWLLKEIRSWLRLKPEESLH